MLKIIRSKSLREKFSGKEDIVSFGQCPLLQYIFAVYYYSVFPQYIPTGYFHSICPVYSNSSFPQYVFTGYFQEADRSSQHFPWKVLWLALGLGSIILAVLLLSVLLGNWSKLFFFKKWFWNSFVSLSLKVFLICLKSIFSLHRRVLLEKEKG